MFLVVTEPSSLFRLSDGPEVRQAVDTIAAVDAAALLSDRAGPLDFPILYADYADHRYDVIGGRPAAREESRSYQ